MLLDSFWLLFASVAAGVAVVVAFVVELSVAVPSVFAVSAVAVSVELAVLPSAFVVEVELELSPVAPELVSSAPGGLAGAGSPGLTVSTTAGELGELGELPTLPDTSVVRFPPLKVSVGPLSDSGSICGFP